jgi:glycine/D-amino acid oxidase-like deaminating enzyme
LIEDLFPASSVDLKPTTDGSSWMIIRNPDEASKRDQITLLLEEPVLEEGSLELAARHDGTIFVCGGSDVEELPEFGSSGVFRPVKSSLEHIGTVLCRYMKPSGRGGVKLEILKAGLSFRPTNELGRPIIASIPRDRITNLALGEGQGRKSGVYVCTGHGNNGITLCLGSGKVMSAMVMGDKPEIDLDAFGLPD